MITNRLCVIAWITFALSASTVVSAQDIGQQIDIYYGHSENHDIRIKMLRIGEPEKEEVLIQISGIDDPISNHIFKYKKEWQNSDKRLNCYQYVTHDVPGHQRYAVFHSEHNGSGNIYKIFLVNMPMNPIYVEPAMYSENLDPVFMYNQYLYQLKNEKP